MAKDSKKLVQAITSQEENFAQWYTDICVKADRKSTRLNSSH